VNEMRKQKAIVIGATGAAGQNIVEFLTNHPWFELAGLAASSKSASFAYSKAIEGAIFFERARIGATCTRVQVQTVHTEAVYVDTKKPCSLDEAKNAMREYVSEPQKLKLPSAPKKPIIVFDGPKMPQPKLHRQYGGDVTLVGRLRRDPVFKNGLAYIVTSDNLDKGAGGGAVQTAEYLKAKRYF